MDETRQIGADRDVDFSRRRMVAGAGAGALALGLAPLGGAEARISGSDVRGLSIVNLHTSESITVDYFAHGKYITEALHRLDRFMRDPIDGTRHRMNPELYDLLNGIYRLMDTPRPLHLISGYRSPATNAMLRRRGRGVAKRSLHMRGLAADIRLPGRDLKYLWRAAKALKRGGVGLYSRSNFIHVDTGRVRGWGV
ncbi:MAG: YcbK family protein [Alphaproteobacteria bacterium]